jgi:hypothetical protein
MSNSGSPIDRRSNLSYEEFVSQYLLPEKPVILTDALAGWTALTKWTPDFFKTVHGNKQVTVDGKQVRLGDYIDMVLASTPEKPCPYLSSLFVRQQFPEIADDIVPEVKYTLPDRLRSRLVSRFAPVPGKFNRSSGIPELLISGLGGRFRLHYDTLHMLGLVTQIYGDKEFIVFAPSDTKYLYPLEEDPKFSAINNPFAPDLEKYPLFAKATPLKFTLRPGETIFNPAGWWHATRILSPSIAMVISTVNGSNWKAFADDIGRHRKGVPRVLTSAFRAYLSLAGVVLSAKERIWPVVG